MKCSRGSWRQAACSWLPLVLVVLSSFGCDDSAVLRLQRKATDAENRKDFQEAEHLWRESAQMVENAGRTRRWLWDTYRDDAYRCLGKLYLRQGRYEDAREALLVSHSYRGAEKDGRYTLAPDTHRWSASNRGSLFGALQGGTS